MEHIVGMMVVNSINEYRFGLKGSLRQIERNDSRLPAFNPPRQRLLGGRNYPKSILAIACLQALQHNRQDSWKRVQQHHNREKHSQDRLHFKRRQMLLTNQPHGQNHRR